MSDSFKELIEKEGVVPKAPGSSAVDDAPPEKCDAPARDCGPNSGVTNEPLYKWRSHSVNEKKSRSLCRGRLPSRDKLDLHGATREEARKKVDDFIAAALLRRHEVVEIVCGRGLHSKEGPVLKPVVCEHLRNHRSVCAYCLVPKTDGAYYVLLKRRGHGHS